MNFHYETAFSRSIGWITKEEQQKIKTFKIAVAGLGGVGGSHLMTLARMGFCHFHIADMDIFELHNMNRQIGCYMSTLGQSKVESISRMLLDINPEIKITKFAKGISKDNLHEFLNAVDIYVDGMDAFEMEVRQMIFDHCQENKIPVTTAAPIGLGTAFVNFLPGKMSFQEYTGITKDMPAYEKTARFILSLSPSFLHKDAIVEPQAFDFKIKKGASTPMGCMLASGVAGCQVLKILLKRKNVDCAPTSYQFDLSKNMLKKTTMFFGHRNPFFILKLILVRKIMIK